MNLNTQRLLLRKLTIEDVPDIYEYSKEVNVGPNAGWKPHESMEETKEIAEAIFLNKDDVWGIVWKQNNKVIGTIGIIEDPKRENDGARMLGYAMSERYWGHGIMTEAVEKVVDYGFNAMNLEVISAYCYPDNERSKRVLEKNGFQYEGTLKRAEKIYNGTVLDNECYSILR